MRRGFDIIFSFVVLLLTIPVFLILALAIKLTSKGPIFFIQTRVGRERRLFSMYKFRSMRVRDDDDSYLTTARDNRITSIGSVMRRLKLDELPQFLNVLKGDMAVVGYRPEVPEYVEKYEPWMNELFQYKPGLTDPASIEYRNEPELLAASDDPERVYREEILPAKLGISLEYMKERTILSDMNVILRTARLIIGG